MRGSQIAESISLVLIWYCRCPYIPLFINRSRSFLVSNSPKQVRKLYAPSRAVSLRFSAPVLRFSVQKASRHARARPAAPQPEERRRPPGPCYSRRPRAAPAGGDAASPAAITWPPRFLSQRYEEVGAAVRSPAGRSLRRCLPVARYVSTAGRGAGSRAGGVGAADPRGRPGGSWGAARGGG